MTFKLGDPCYRLHPVWSDKLDKRLLGLIGRKSYGEMARIMGKSVDALRKRARFLGHRLDQGTTTLRALARETDYDRHQLRRAAKHLGQQWKRATNRKLLITTEQADELVKCLATERWKAG